MAAIAELSGVDYFEMQPANNATEHLKAIFRIMRQVSQASGPSNNPDEQHILLKRRKAEASKNPQNYELLLLLSVFCLLIASLAISICSIVGSLQMTRYRRFSLIRRLAYAAGVVKPRS